MNTIAIPIEEYNNLKRRADAYDKMHAKRFNITRNAGKVSAAKLTPEQRSERAKKAVAARMAKYGQKSHKQH